jgi:hypothetical protein
MSRVSKRKIKKFLTLNFYKNKDYYNKELELAIEVIQDFLNCDPVHIGRLQGNTFTTVYEIDGEVEIAMKARNNHERKSKSITRNCLNADGSISNR